MFQSVPMNSECLCPSPGRFSFYVRRGAAGLVANQQCSMVGTDVVCEWRWSQEAGSLLGIGTDSLWEFCAWHIDTSTVSEHQVLWAFSGTWFLITSTSRIGCGQIGGFLLPLLELLWCSLTSSHYSSQIEEPALLHRSVAGAHPEHSGKETTAILRAGADISINPLLIRGPYLPAHACTFNPVHWAVKMPNPSPHRFI